MISYLQEEVQVQEQDSRQLGSCRAYKLLTHGVQVGWHVQITWSLLSCRRLDYPGSVQVISFVSSHCNVYLRVWRLAVPVVVRSVRLVICWVSVIFNQRQVSFFRYGRLVKRRGRWNFLSRLSPLDLCRTSFKLLTYHVP